MTSLGQVWVKFGSSLGQVWGGCTLKIHLRCSFHGRLRIWPQIWVLSVTFSRNCYIPRFDSYVGSVAVMHALTCVLMTSKATKKERGRISKIRPRCPMRLCAAHAASAVHKPSRQMAMPVRRPPKPYHFQPPRPRTFCHNGGPRHVKLTLYRRARAPHPT